jgi:2C-methyl-D-erythritol 2,4-cyclodiphosphate synthase
VRVVGELFRGRWGRVLGIAVRTAHLGAMAVLVGGIHFAAADPALHAWRVLTAATGLLLLAVEASHSRHWVYQGRGVVALLHLSAPALLLVPAVTGRAAILAALGLGAVGSHLPRAARKWSFRHRRVVE